MAASKRLTPEQRTRRARIAAEASWAKTEDRAARTAPARKAALDRFDRQVDPDGLMDPRERAIRAAHARKAFWLRVAYRQEQARLARQAETT